LQGDSPWCCPGVAGFLGRPIPGGQRWIFSKGPAGGQRSSVDAAIKAAFDEAGISGKVLGDPLGSYKRLNDGKLYDVTVYLMEAVRSGEAWLEFRVRQSRWVRVQEAKTLLVMPELQDMLGRTLLAIAG
jgi:hypothetical protein